MKYDLAALARQRGLKRKRIVMPAIAGTRAQQDELARIYARVVKAWEIGLTPIMVAYADSLATAPLDSMTRDAAPDVQRAINGVESEASRIILTLTPSLREWALRIERFVRGKFSGAVLSATGVNLDTVIGPADARDTLDTWVARNVSLVRDVSDQARGRISDAVFRGINRRTPAREVAKELRGIVAMSRTRSIFIARDQLSKVTAQLAAERRRQAGIDKFEWMHSGKTNGRPEHESWDGDTFTESNPPPDRAGEEPNCGCRERAVLELD